MTDIKELEEKIKIYNKKYYDGNEQITDKEYDMLIAELRALDPENKLLDTVIDNCDNIEGFKKVELPIVMGTLKKCQNEEQILKEFKQEIGTYLLEDKIDGVSACVSFENGIFSQATSRGNAEFGFDITNNFSQIEFKNKNSQVYIDGTYLFNGYIRGEVYMKKEIFEKYFKDKMKNPRAAAAGLMKRLDASDCKYLSFIAYDVFNDYFADKTEKDKLMFLANNGFEVPRFTVAKSPQEIIDFRKKSYETKDKLPYPVDGIVAKSMNVDYQDLSRVTPMKNFAIKYDLDYAISKIIDIEWSMSGTILSPVAIIEPVELNGTTVQRASLHNINKMEELGVEIGKSAMITKRGEIVPKVEKIID